MIEAPGISLHSTGSKVCTVSIFLSWRELLGKLIQDSQERQRIINAIGVNSVTLTRWVTGSSNPRPQHLRNLLIALSPELRTTMFDAIVKEYPEFSVVLSNGLADETQEEIPSTFYSR